MAGAGDSVRLGVGGGQEPFSSQPPTIANRNKTYLQSQQTHILKKIFAWKKFYRKKISTWKSFIKNICMMEKYLNVLRKYNNSLLTMSHVCIWLPPILPGKVTAMVCLRWQQQSQSSAGRNLSDIWTHCTEHVVSLFVLTAVTALT